MSPTKSTASLEPSLLARKGGARPAMRPQLQRLQVENASCEEAFHDLGWNDMGFTSYFPKKRVSCSPFPEAMHSQRCKSRSVSRPPREVTEATTSQPVGQRALTIRLDQDQHLQLRLAAVLENRSAQQLARHALDVLLADMSNCEQPAVTDGERI
jgi:hypothetical protein